jgi:hypothetical protein
MDARSPRRRFQFSLRTLMLFAVIGAVHCALRLPMLKEWQAQNEVPAWHDLGGTGSIAPYPTNCSFGRIIRIRRLDGGFFACRFAGLRLNRQQQSPRTLPDCG